MPVTDWGVMFGRRGAKWCSLESRVRELQDEVAFLRESLIPETTGADSRDYLNHPNVQLGDHCRLAPDVNIMASSADYRVVIGNHVKINRRAEICGPVSIRDHTFINSDSYIRQQTVIGSRVLLGPFVRLISDTHDLGTTQQRAGKGKVAAVTVGDGAWIGANVTVIGPVTIGAGSMVAAGCSWCSCGSRRTPEHTRRRSAGKGSAQPLEPLTPLYPNPAQFQQLYDWARRFSSLAPRRSI